MLTFIPKSVQLNSEDLKECKRKVKYLVKQLERFSKLNKDIKSFLNQKDTQESGHSLNWEERKVKPKWEKGSCPNPGENNARNDGETEPCGRSGAQDGKTHRRVTLSYYHPRITG